MSLVVFDMGGSSIKYGLWKQQTISQLGRFTTPSTFEKLKLQFKQVIAQFKEEITGIAISAPGAVNVNQRTIEGNQCDSLYPSSLYFR